MQGATAGQMAGGIDLTNTGGAACALHGHPVVQLLSPTGSIIPALESRGLRLYPKPLTWPQIVIQPGGSAWVNVISTNWCGPRPAARGVAAAAARNRHAVTGAVRSPMA
jgi:hypothetical protein